jgi:hypothetical protein
VSLIAALVFTVAFAALLAPVREVPSEMCFRNNRGCCSDTRSSLFAAAVGEFKEHCL